MARVAERLPENVPGEFFVDAGCIDCDTCRELAPATFAASPRRSAAHVQAQPRTPEEHHRACMALVSCPTASIGTAGRPRPSLRAAVAALPEPVAGVPGVFYCGYASADSYGAASYLIVRPQGNVLVDSPRAARPLLDRIASLGGVSLMFLSHRDDVADHAVFARRFGCRRILAAADVDAGTRDVELKLEGDAPVRLADDLVVIPVPGHTRGSAALLYRDEVLFSGDHLWADGDGLDAGRSVCWYSWSAQRRSLERLLAHRFRAVLPGHGGRLVTGAPEAARAALRALLGRL